MAPNSLYYGDNLDVLGEHVASQSVDLVYLDSAFNANRNYNVIFARHDVKTRHDVKSSANAAQIPAFGDTWHSTLTTGEQCRDATAGGVPRRHITTAAEPTGSGR